jgi:hypothetical protein
VLVSLRIANNENMKMKTLTKTAPACLAAAGLLSLAAAMSASAAAPPALQAQIVTRPLTPGDKAAYKLSSSLEVSGGLKTVGVGTPVYLEVEVNIAVPAADITNVTWGVSAQPIGSAAALLPSPLGTNVPIYEPADRSVAQVAGRMMLRPDVAGQYQVTATIQSASSGTTNLTLNLTTGTYVGVNTCALCHSGGLVAPDKVHPWQTTAHSKIFTEGIDGLLGHYSQSCLACHTVGYDTATNAVNGGFDDIATQVGWTFPTVLTNGNWDAMDPKLKNLANIQCENCHGPGSEHAAALGNTSVSNWPRLSVTVNSGDCNQCHDAPTHHIKGTEWYTSGHANTTRIPSGPSRPQCVGCHTADGFIGRIKESTTTNTTFSAIGCQTCHEPHGETTPTNNPHLLRMLSDVTMPDGTVVSNAGEGALCLQCHHVRNGAATNNIANYQQGKPTWYGGSSFGVHDGPQGDMIEGVNAITYGKDIPSSAHRYTVTNLCVGCHMQATAATTDPSFLKAGGHTFHMSYSVVDTNGVTNTVDRTDACVQCHGPIDDFDMPRQDYNGDGVIEGVQTEVQHMLDQLSTMLPGSAYRADGNYVADGLVKSSLSTKTNWQTKFLNAAYDWQFVNNDGSKGVHNAPFATGLLKAAMADLTGDSNSDGLPDSWQIQYFGSATSSNAAPNANPSGDGVPNWLKYNLGLDPTVPGTSMPDGVVFANGKALVSNGSETNSLAIYTAAEVAFNTEVGKTYQIQAISALTATWSNVGSPIAGTGTPMSYVTPTRGNAQQFFRVVHSP